MTCPACEAFPLVHARDDRSVEYCTNPTCGFKKEWSKSELLGTIVEIKEQYMEELGGLGRATREARGGLVFAEERRPPEGTKLHEIYEKWATWHKKLKDARLRENDEHK